MVGGGKEWLGGNQGIALTLRPHVWLGGNSFIFFIGVGEEETICLWHRVGEENTWLGGLIYNCDIDTTVSPIVIHLN